MGVKYILQYKAIDKIAWECWIETPSYTGNAVAIHGVSEHATELSYDGDTADDAFNTFIKSSLVLSFYNEGQVDMDELMGADDKTFFAKLFRNGLLYWTGYLTPENVQRKLITPPYDCTLTFVCGLSLLDTIPYVHQDLPGLTGLKNRCPMNYIRQVLFGNLDIRLPIRWTNSLECTAFTDDFFVGSVRWSPFNEGIYTYQQGVTGDALGPAQTCGYILKGILAAAQCRIYQCNGKWIIRRVNEVIAGVVSYKEIAADFGVMTVHSGTENLSKHIGRSGYRFINENAILTNKQGIKSFKTTYAANIRSNIIPNGNFDVINTTFTLGDIANGELFEWGSYDPVKPVVNARPSLDGRSGYSAELTNTDVSDAYFSMVVPGGSLYNNGLPIDAYTLLKLINFSFMISPGPNFAPVDGSDIIIWDSNPLQFKMILHQGANTYFLTEFGIWSAVDAWIPIVVQGLKINDVASVNFDKFQGVKIPQPATQPVAGDLCDLQIVFKVKEGQTYTLDNVQITIDNATDVYEVFDDHNKNTSADNQSLTISSSFGGYMLSNFMSSPFNSGAESRFNDGAVYSGTLTGVNSQAIMRFRYKASQIVNTDMWTEGRNWSFDEIYSVDSLLGKKFLPLNAKYYIEKCQVNMIAMEGRNDNITLRESFYSSNDNLNSN